LLEHYDPMGAGRRIEDFVDILSNWYVRRSRRRFWKSENDADKLAAHTTLYRCLVTLSKLLAPFTPFVVEETYQNLVRSAFPEQPLSVHLADFPKPDLSLIDEDLEADTRTVMKVCSLGRAARSKTNLKVRQPLAKVLVKARSRHEKEGLARQAPQILDELNVKEIELIDDESLMLDYEIKANLMLVGRKYTRDVPNIVAALAKLDPHQVAGHAARGELIIAGTFRLLPEDVLVITHDRPGYAVASEVGLMVGITTQITPELAAEGKARELVHRLQTMRRSAGFDIADYIVTYYQTSGPLKQVIEEYSSYLKPLH
jgi:isoleucyl-tRNA synthetase